MSTSSSGLVTSGPPPPPPSGVSEILPPMDLAPKGPSVVQLRPFSSALPSKGGVNVNASPVPLSNPIISVNRTTTPTANLILPSRAGFSQGIPTYQITRVGNVRGQQPASITVTPLPPSNIRLAANVGSNNGSWQGASFSQIRPTITVGRGVRPGGDKIIHVPQVAQLQVVDGKGSILKPQQITTPIVNIRGTLPGGGTAVTLPIQPFTIRTTTTIRPTTTNSSNPPVKVIQGHTPIQFVNANKNVIQAITTPLSTAKLSTVCLTLSTNATQAPNSTSPAVAVASRQAPPSLIMTPSPLPTGLASATPPTTTLPITKVYPVGRDVSGQLKNASGNANPLENMFGGGGPNSVTVSNVNITAPYAAPSTSAHVHTTPTINVHSTSSSTPSSHTSTCGLPQVAPPNLAPGSIPPGYYIDKGGGVGGGGGGGFMNILPQTRPIALDKKTIDAKSLPVGSLIIAAGGPGTHPSTVAIPLTSTTAQHLNITHHLGGVVHTTTGGAGAAFSSTTSTTTITPQNHILAQIPFSGAPTITMTPSGSSAPLASHPQIHGSGPSSSGPGVGPASILTMTVTTTTITSNTSSITSGSSSSSNSGAAITIATATTTTSSSSCSSSTSSSATSTSGGSSTTSGSSSTSSTTTTTTQPAQSPNHNSSNSKTTHSPRPSILRKRELGDHHHQLQGASRAQRNLSVQLNFSSSSPSFTCNSSSNKENSIAAAIEKFPGAAGAGGGGGANGSSVSILKKEFQPPIEESSCQSVSSNSSSGSSTISTTSETAELQMQQQLGLVDLNLSSLPLHHHLHTSGAPSETTSAFVGLNSLSNNPVGGGKSTTSGLGLGLFTNSLGSSSATNQNQNGVLRATQPRSRSTSTSKGSNKDVERLKSKKDSDSVSPRKKPRKQQLTSSDLLEAASPEIYYQGQGKRFRKSELMNFADGPSIPDKDRPNTTEPTSEEPPPSFFYFKKRHMSLIQADSIPPKPLTTHFQRYCDVKARDEKRPTISELANQKNILQKVTGWRVQHMTTQMGELVEGESNVVNRCTALLSKLESKIKPNSSDRDLNLITELLKGNLQRCKVIRDQMSESEVQAKKILEHKPHVLEVINKYSNKRPQGKKRTL